MSWTYRCKGGLPCDLRIRNDEDGNPLDFKRERFEQCIICGKKVKFNKYSGREDNVAYLDAHPRDFCQRTGRYAKLYEQLYGRPADIRSKGTNGLPQQLDFGEDQA